VYSDGVAVGQGILVELQHPGGSIKTAHTDDSGAYAKSVTHPTDPNSVWHALALGADVPFKTVANSIVTVDIHAGPQPTPSLTVGPSVEPSVTPQRTPSAKATVVPCLYKMFDWGTDYQTLHPEYGPIGSIHFYDWRAINPGPGQYNWDIIDRELAKEAALRVTMLDGTEIAKPVVIQVMVHLSSACDGYNDRTPGWVYQGFGEMLDGRKVGHVLTTMGQDANGLILMDANYTSCPAYEQEAWRAAYADMVRALGARYDGKVTAIVISCGLDGETGPIKDPWWAAFRAISGIEYRWGQWVFECMDLYAAAFPSTPVFLNNAPGGKARKPRAEYAAALGIGLKHSGMQPAQDSAVGYGEYVGSWDMFHDYPLVWCESAHAIGFIEGIEWAIWAYYQGLSFSPAAIDVHPELIESMPPAFLRWVQGQLQAPHPWMVMRDMEYPVVMWGDDGVSDHVGDFGVGIERLTENEVMGRKGLPRDPGTYQGRQCRRIDGIMRLQAEHGGIARVTLLDLGGPVCINGQEIALADSGQWVTVSVATERNIIIEGEGYVHMVEVVAQGTPTGTATATQRATSTPSPSPTPTRTSIPSVTARPTAMPTYTSVPSPTRTVTPTAAVFRVDIQLEPPTAGVTVRLDTSVGGISATTDADGRASLYGYRAETFTLTVEPPEGMRCCGITGPLWMTAMVDGCTLTAQVTTPAIALEWHLEAEPVVVWSWSIGDVTIQGLDDGEMRWK